MIGRKLFLTGAAGMVGRNILEHPKLANWTVLKPTRAELDLTDRGAVDVYVRRHRPDLIIHAAGRVGGIQANIQHPVDFLVQNLDVGRNVIMAAFEAGVPAVLNLASSCMYPRDRTGELQEDMILSGMLEPTNEGYALAKIMATRLCQYIVRQSSHLNYKTLVPCNIYGKYDKFGEDAAHLVPSIIRKVHSAKVRNLATVDIWGSGNARREFMYAEDLADAVLTAAEDMANIPDIMNIGLENDHSINAYYEHARAIIGWEGSFVHDLDKPVGMIRKKVDISSQKDWGWAASTSLDDGIAKTYDFYLETIR